MRARKARAFLIPKPLLPRTRPTAQRVYIAVFVAHQLQQRDSLSRDVCHGSARAASGLSQAQFAARMGVSVRALQEREQGRRCPSGAAHTLLAVAQRRPVVRRELVA
jgi:DNA-binding transcriptional regulator YiaG